MGTGYNWYILARQVVTKLDANTYSTEMEGRKYKLAHMSTKTAKWSASEKAQTKRLIEIFESAAQDLRERLEKEEALTGSEEPLPAKAARRTRSATPARSRTERITE